MKKKTTIKKESKIYSPVGNLAERAKQIKTQFNHLLRHPAWKLLKGKDKGEKQIRKGKIRKRKTKQVAKN